MLFSLSIAYKLYLKKIIFETVKNSTNFFAFVFVFFIKKILEKNTKKNFLKNYNKIHFPSRLKIT